MKVFLTLLIAMSASIAGANDFKIIAPEAFKKVIGPDAKLEKLAGDMKFTEGPVWVGGKNAKLIFSDIPANHLYQWDKAGGLKIFREDSQNANGNTVDHQNRLITAEHSGRRLSLLEKDGTVRSLVAEHAGGKLNSPNDVVVKSDGTLWFTDPDYGLGQKKKEQEGNFVYRFDPKSGEVTALVKDFDKPNGLCFSPDEKKLYVADSGKPHHIRVFQVNDGKTLGAGMVFAVIDQGVPDGIRCDQQGRVWSSAGDGVHIFARDGQLIGKILVPESPANLCFGGEDGKTLFITARKSLYAIETKTKSGTKK